MFKTTSRLSVVSFTRTSYKANSDSVFVFKGTAATTVAVANGSIADIAGLDVMNQRVFKNCGSANMTLSGSFWTTAAVASVVLTPGQGCIMYWDDKDRWIVIQGA